MGIETDRSGQRVFALDAVRGVAIGGIALMNIYSFAFPSAAYFNPNVPEPAGAGDVAIWFFSYLFVDNKFRTLFAMLFGLGCAILFERSRDKPYQRHYARMTVLFAFGVAHYVVLASNDILRLYAICGLFLPFVFRWRAKRLVTSSLVLMALHTIAGSIIASGWMIPDTSGHALAQTLFGSDANAVSNAAQRAQQSIIERMSSRLNALPRSLLFLSSSLLLNLSGMTMGIALWRSGYLKGEKDDRALKGVAKACLAVALPALALVAFYVLWSDFTPGIVGAAALFWTAPFDLMIGIAYAVCLIAWFRNGGTMTTRFEAAGRLSFTNYIATSIFFAALFHTWGFGLWGQFDRAAAFVIACIPMVLMLAISGLVLRRFKRGPVERLWRYLSALPFHKRALPHDG